jgi:hypothetical protein
MQYNDFIKLRRVGAVAVLGLAVVGGFLACNRPQKAEPIPPVLQPNTTNPEPQAPAENPNPPAEQPSKPSDPLALTDVHKEILRLQQQPLTVSGAKPAEGGLQWRIKDNGITVEFRSDTNKGSTTWNRAKVDYNGNKKYEERWDFKENSIIRRVSPADDDNYTDKYTKLGDVWQKQ